MIRLREIRRKCSNRTRQLHVPSGSSNRVIGPLCDIPIFREKGTTKQPPQCWICCELHLRSDEITGAVGTVVASR